MPTQSDRERPFLTAYLDLHDSLRAQRLGRGGVEVCHALTSSLDVGIEELVSHFPDEMAIVATGGYGRGELSPHSDVDLMLLHAVDDPSKWASSLFRPLWDANLRVGHAVRTVKEAASAAKERFDTHTTLLTSRLVAGSEELFGSLMSEIATVTKARPLRLHLVEEERERRRQSPYLQMAPDVKTGRGGLRTLHGFEWERRREELIGRFSPDSRLEESEARESLLRIRNALHTMTGRPHDVFSSDLRELVARWLGLGVHETAAMLIGAVHAVDLLAGRRWPEVTRQPVGPFGRRLRAPLSGSDRTPASARSPSFEEIIRLLRTGEQGRDTFERLWDAGLLTELVPGWGTVRARPQLAPFHQHPVDAHLWRTVEEMRALIADDGHYGRVAREIGQPDLLLIAAFLHDIGKGHDGDHAEVGAGMARSFCERLGLSGHARDQVETAVRHHLLLARTATRRDLDDPAVIDEVAATVGRLETLQMIYLLTVADSRATGPSMWSQWKATLLRTLFTRCASRFGAEEPTGPDHAAFRATVLDLAGTARRSAEDHLAGMPAEYLWSTSPEDVLWHLELIDATVGMSNLGVRAGGAAGTAVVVGRVGRGFRQVVAESFAAHGIDVLEARLFSRADGMIIDSYRVRDDRTGEFVPPERWEGARSDIEAALQGELDTGGRVAARAAAYRPKSAMQTPPRVEGSIDTATGDLVVTIKCSDRIGRLAEILVALHECDLEIALAKLDSRGEELVDSFHVRGQGVLDTAGIDRLAGRIAESIIP